jgi:flagellar biosynthesis protein FliQ
MAGTDSLMQQHAASNQITIIIPVIISIAVISGLTYLLLGKSNKINEMENSSIFRILASLTTGVILGFLISQAIYANPAYHQMMTSIL